ncbi:MAG: hypothetical protein M0Q43_14350, partial [Methanothrix sp.]|nr:hypothetical protein [Methanothrix sp.]
MYRIFVLLSFISWTRCPSLDVRRNNFGTPQAAFIRIKLIYSKPLLTIVNRIPEIQTTISDRRKSPCEMVIWDVLPSIRAAIAEELMKRDLPQKEISRLLGITPPAVSQYLSKKRGYNIEFGEDIKVSISQLANDL